MAAATYFNKFPSYCRMVAHAKSLAKRSILIDHCGLDQIDLKSELVNAEQIYSIEKETRRGYSKLTLIEFKSDDDADCLVKRANHNDGLLPVPLKILRYNGRAGYLPLDTNEEFSNVERIRLSFEKEVTPSFSNYTELIKNNMMSLISLKLRFITLVNFEQILCSGMFEEYELMPFGSSVIDMGCDSGDLDILITRKTDHYEAIRRPLNNKALQNLITRRDQEAVSPSNKLAIQKPSKLVHLDKSLYSETKDNSGFRGTMRWFDYILREYMPLTDGFGVLTLHRAKVPIIKFTSRITNIDCDLSFDLGLDHRDIESSVSAHPSLLMTEILYSLSRQNNLIVAFVIYMRIFAKLNSITSKVPGIGMTNFQFQSILIFFLQHIYVLPNSNDHADASRDQESNVDGSKKFSKLVSLSHHNIVFACNDDIHNYQSAIIPPFKSLLNHVTGVKEERKPIHFEDEELNHILPALIVKFFNFYSNFDFSTKTLNLLDSKQELKLDNSTMFVLNPIEPNRNICHNVNRKALELFVRQVRSASLSIRTSRRTVCPLSIIKDLMIKHQRLVKKNRTRGISFEDLDSDVQPFDPDGIAEDVCR